MAGFGDYLTNGIGSGQRVVTAIANASRSTGVDFGYLMGQAQIESAMNPEARASQSSATGLYQFLDQSWLKVINDHGSRYGLGWAADAVQQGANGRFYVADPAVRQQILDLRKHPETASVMAAEFAADNRAYLESQTGRQAEPVDLYLAHFLGAGGAAKFLNVAATNPEASGAALFPAAARTNRAVFYDQHGNARSLGDIRDNFARKLASGADAAGADWPSAGRPGGFGNYVQPADYVRIEQQRLSQSQDMAEATDYPEFQTQPQTATLAYLMLATLGR